MSHLSRAAVLACQAIIVVNFIITSVKSYHNHLSRAAVLACQAIRATRAVVAPVPSAKEISDVAQRVGHYVTLARHRVWPLPAASWENEEEIWSPALARGPPESRAVTVRATTF